MGIQEIGGRERGREKNEFNLKFCLEALAFDFPRNSFTKMKPKKKKKEKKN